MITDDQGVSVLVGRRRSWGVSRCRYLPPRLPFQRDQDVDKEGALAGEAETCDEAHRMRATSGGGVSG